VTVGNLLAESYQGARIIRSLETYLERYNKC
jgi:hypothetical protein